jgi:uncharacterized protein
VASSTGIDRVTGKALSDWPHVVQSIFLIFTTMLASRVMRRNFGSAIPGLLGRNLTINTLQRFTNAIVIAIILWEPRFRVVRVIYPNPTDTPDNVRIGKIEFQIVGAYRPRALQNDFSEQPVPRTVTLSFPQPFPLG